ncbi:nucleotidyltransferase domain-containing protein [Methylorubrum thiocyanatum]|uniref:nucleotidyltransferase domain-containing protein n=1 Tax=Methylorubrum thiocyanatum TaxID=47958 RepID=UPI003F7DA24C
MMSPFEKTKIYSEEKLDALRKSIENVVPDGNIVLTCGSYARREASDNSDIDFFVISQDDDQSESNGSLAWIEEVHTRIAKHVEVEPAKGGPFAKREFQSNMLKNIGGDEDTNQKLTRRMLFLLEGEYLHNKSGLESFRRKVLERYIRETITDHQLALFLLNDIIRYYRTIATDYEFKTSEVSKPWGIRNIKLVFSRKLLYASGLFCVAATADRMHNRKIEYLERLFNMPVLDRMADICGQTQLQEVIKSYNYFLEKMESPEVRDVLKNLKPEDRGNAIFRDLKNEGHHFTRELLKLFENTFDSTHPIRRAVLF